MQTQKLLSYYLFVDAFIVKFVGFCDEMIIDFNNEMKI